MRSETAAMQPFLDCSRNQILLRQLEVATCWLDCIGLYAAAHPEQSPQIDTDGCSRQRIEGIGNVNPGTNLSSLSGLRQKGKSEGRSPGTFRADQLAQSSDREASVKHIVQSFNARRGDRPHHSG